MGNREQVEHQCRQGNRCKSRVRDSDGEYHGAGVERPDSLCRPCEHAAFESMRRLHADWCALEWALTDAWRSRVDGGPKVRGTAERSIPLPLAVDTLMTAIDTELTHWTLRVTRGEPLPMHPRDCVERCVAILGASTGTLVDLPPRAMSVLLPRPDGGDNLGTLVLDGVDAVLRLAELHRRAVSVLGLTETREMLRDPCPHCGRKALAVSRDQTLVTCQGCRISWDKERFALLYNVLDFERQQVRQAA